MASAAWTRKAGKSKSGGLNAKGRASYNRQLEVILKLQLNLRLAKEERASANV